MLLNIRTPHLSNLTSITASPRLSSHMRCVEPPPSATSNHSRSCVVGFFFNRHERFTMQRHLLSRCYHRYMRISIGLKKKKSLLVWKNVQHTHLRKVKFVCRCSFPLKLHQHRWRLVSAPPFKQRGCCSLWHQLPQTAPWHCWKINISPRTDRKSDESCY